MKVELIPLNKIKLGSNSRLTHSDEELFGLMQAIKESGLLQPIGVVKKATGSNYEIAYGNRRFLAWSKLYDNKPIPAVVHEGQSESEVEIKNLVENIQRRNISIGEAGRYFKILRERGLSIREVATRIGCGTHYVKTALASHEEIPVKYRDKITSSFGGKRVNPGEISYRIAQNIVSASKSYNLNHEKRSKLFDAALKDPEKFQQHESVKKYATAIVRGKSDFMAESVNYRNVVVALHIPEKECERLERDFIDNGPFRTLQGLIRAIVRGEKAMKVKCL